MKTCPFCKAEIEENARFCLYCMTPLEEKQLIKNEKPKRRWPVILAIVFAVVLAAASIFVLFNGNKKTGKSSDPSQGSTETLPGDDTGSEDSADVPSGDTPTDDTGNSDTPTGDTPSGGTPSGDTPSDDTPSGGNDTSDNLPNETPDDEESDDPVESPDEEQTPNTPETPPQAPAVIAPVYTYRDATHGDDFSVSADLDNAIVIIGVSTPSSTGEYEIPETIDGKRVIAIMESAFSHDAVKDTVKTVIIPASIKTIHANAFLSCRNMTDIYLRGNAVYIDANAFEAVANRTGELTIHCSYNCSNRNLRYYRNIAADYNAKYEEWNG